MLVEKQSLLKQIQIKPSTSIFVCDGTNKFELIKINLNFITILALLVIIIIIIIIVIC
jgi:hypothetical protein